MDHQQEWEQCIKATTDVKLKELKYEIRASKSSCPTINILKQYIKYKLQKGLKLKGMILANVLEDLKQEPAQSLHRNISPLIRLELSIIYTEIVTTQDLVNKQGYVEKISEHLQYLQKNKQTLELPDAYSLNHKIAIMVDLMHKGFKHEAKYKINRLATRNSTNKLTSAKEYINRECNKYKIFPWHRHQSNENSHLGRSNRM